MMGKVQIVWKWKVTHAPANEPMPPRWRFNAHGAAYDMREAEEAASMIRSHGKIVRLLPI